MAVFVSKSIVIDGKKPLFNPDLRKGSVHFTVEPPAFYAKAHPVGTVAILLDGVRVPIFPNEFSYVDEVEEKEVANG